MSRKEMLLKDNYKVNEKEYIRLITSEKIDLLNFEEWKIFYKWVGIHKKLNGLFKNDPFILRLLFSLDYMNFVTDKNEFGCIGQLNDDSFDHTSSMQLRSDVSMIQSPDTVTGVITFPYFNSWDEIRDWVERVPEDNYGVYIINPLLINYGMGAVGLFLTPKYSNGYVIELCNHYIIGLTGYPLFLTFSNEEKVDEIKYVDLDLSVDDFIEEFCESSENDKCLLKILNFWKDNDEVSIPSVEDNYKSYMDVQPYYRYNNINFLKIISKVPFKLVHEDSGNVLGLFKEFSLDAPFKVIDTDNGEFKLSQNQLDGILNGKYDFRIDR